MPRQKQTEENLAGGDVFSLNMDPSIAVPPSLVNCGKMVLHNFANISREGSERAHANCPCAPRVSHPENAPMETPATDAEYIAQAGVCAGKERQDCPIITLSVVATTHLPLHKHLPSMATNFYTRQYDPSKILNHPDFRIIDDAEN